MHLLMNLRILTLSGIVIWGLPLLGFTEPLPQNHVDENFYNQYIRQNSQVMFLEPTASPQALQKMEQEATAALAKNPKDAFALRKLANVQLSRNQDALAEATLRRALAIEPSSATANSMLATLLMKANRQVEAIHALTMVVKQPDVPPPMLVKSYTSLCSLQGDQQQLHLALSACQQAITLDSKHAVAYLNLGRIYFMLAQYQPSITSSQKAIQLDPNLGYLAHSNISVSQMQLQAYDQAASEAKKAIAQKPDYEPAYYNLGTAYLYLKNYPLAEQNLDRALAIDPNATLARYNRLLLYCATNQNAKALKEAAWLKTRPEAAWSNTNAIAQQCTKLGVAVAR